MRTRSQAAATRSPLHSLSQEERKNKKTAARRARKTTTTTTTTTETIEITKSVATAKANGIDTNAVNGASTAATATAKVTNAAPVANHASPTAPLSSPSVVETPTKPTRSTKSATTKSTAKPSRAARPSQPIHTTPVSNPSNAAQTSQTTTAAPAAEHTDVKPKIRERSKLQPMSDRPTRTRNYPRSKDDPNRPPTHTRTHLQSNGFAGAETAEAQQPVESQTPAHAEKLAEAPKSRQTAQAAPRRTRAKSTPRAEAFDGPRIDRRPRQPPINAGLSGEELLKAIREARDEGRIAQYGTAAVETPREKEQSSEDTLESQQAPQTPVSANTTAPVATPRSTGWGIKSLFTNFLPTIFGSGGRQTNGVDQATASPTPQTQQTSSSQQPAAQQDASQQTSAILLPQDDVDAIGAALLQSPTPAEGSTRRAKSKSQARAKSKQKKRRNSSQIAIIDYAMRDVHPAEEALAISWAEKTAEKISKDKATLGSKRKQLEQPMKLKEVKEIPARRPWEPSGSYGLLPEFFEDSDSDEEAPGWYLVDQLANEQPPMKKRKTSARSSDAEPPASSKTPLRVIDTNGNSASRHDRRPRPSTIPSPMFDNPVTHHEGGNVFNELHTQTPAPITPARDRDAFLKELRRTGHVEGSGSFCVPESDSDDSEDENDQENSMPWTQQPPPAPVPAHAQLPVPLDGSASVPQFQKSRALDPVEAQRAKAMKHTPAKKSRLREVMMPSPSLKSDGGGSPFTRGSLSGHSASLFNGASSIRVLSDEDLPDATPLDMEGIQFPYDDPLGLRDLGLMDDTMAVVDGSPVFGGDEAVMTYDEDEEAISDEDEEL